jgi:hypothetical protein
MKRVLVFPCGSEIGLEINRALSYSMHFDLIGASSVSSNHGKFVYKDYVEEAPYVDDHDFVDKINEIICTKKIDYIIPAHDSVIVKLAKEREKIKCEVIAPDYNTCEICRSKKITYDFFKKDIITPKVYTSDQKLNFPVFLKPEVGQGSKGTYLVESLDEMKFYLKKDPTLMILEYLPGREYTIDCFTDKNGNLLFVGGRERSRISNGISVSTHIVVDERFDTIAKIINDKLNLRGAWFFQVKENENGDLALLEIAPRIAGSMGLYRNLGINFILLTLFDRMGTDVTIFKNNFDIEMDRALVNRFRLSIDYKRVYIDLDDTIIINGRINNEMVSFIYQCINKKIEINLITRHKKNIEETLKQYRIRALFDNIIYISNDSEKYENINGEESIFIDDSFAERKKVHEHLKIPTFDTSSIESLLDWRI